MVLWFKRPAIAGKTPALFKAGDVGKGYLPGPPIFNLTHSEAVIEWLGVDAGDWCNNTANRCRFVP